MEEIPGSINIGGRVTREQWDQMVEREGLLFDLDPAGGDTGEGDEAYILCGSVTINDGCAAYGHFKALEAYLVEQGIPYDRQADAAYEYDAEEASFRPGMDDELVAQGQQNGGIMVPVDEVLDLIEKRVRTMNDIIALGEDAPAGFRLAALRRSQPLPPFEFVESGS